MSTNALAVVSFKDADVFLQSAAADKGLSDRAFRLLFRLVRHVSHKTGDCFPSHATLAKGTGSSLDWVKRGLAELVRLGLVVVTRDRRERRTNVYELRRERYGSPVRPEAEPARPAEPAEPVASDQGEAAGWSPSRGPASSDVERAAAKRAADLAWRAELLAKNGAGGFRPGPPPAALRMQPMTV